MEIGSFIELQLPKNSEYYNKNENTARLNSGRAAIYHSLRILGCKTVWLPYYQCDTVRDFLQRKEINIKYYYIDNKFNPLNINQEKSEAVVLVNYFGIMSSKRMNELANKYKNVIIDNSQGFFCESLSGCMNVYSARKFVGVPDGAYVVGSNADSLTEEYKQGYSSDTSLFLLQRIEYGCEGKTYESRTKNENRIDEEDIMKMSALTRAILDGTDYDFIVKKRQENFEFANSLFKDINKTDPKEYYDNTCVPMVYPLVVEDDDLLNKLLDNKHFQGHWWQYLTEELPESDFEHWLSRYVIPITIDQRYGRQELERLRGLVE